MGSTGIVKAISGDVKAISLDGTERTLLVGDTVEMDEQIITGAFGSVVISFSNGAIMDLGHDSMVTLNEEAITPDTGASQTAQSPADAQSEVAAIQAALESDDNFDPSNLPATAAGTPEAGVGSEDGGSTIVNVDYLNPEETPESGFDTVGISQSFDVPEDDLQVSTDGRPSITTIAQTDVAYEFTITNRADVSSAGYKSSYGYYIKDAAGNPTTGVVVWDNVQGNDTDPVSVTGFSPDQIGFFIIPNGENRNSSLDDNTEVTFKFVDGSGNEVSVGTAGGQWQAFDGGVALTGNGSHVLFDVAALNLDGQDHVKNTPLAGSQNWEDLQIPRGDGDYNDVNINVEWTSVTATGSVADAQFGADGPGSVDFSLGSVTILGGLTSKLGDLTSSGESIFFTARDTDADGNDDLLVGSTSSGDVLTIDGILDSGDLDITLLGPIDSTNSGSNDVQITANVQVTDSDGDIATAILNFNIDVSILDAPAIETI